MPLLIICAVCLTGYAADTYVPRLSDKEYGELAVAAEAYSRKQQPVPEPIQRLKPIEVYYHMANVVIALHRDGHEEHGYYIHTGLSSNIPTPNIGAWRDWTLTEVKSPAIPSLDTIYEYSRRR